MGEFIFAWLGVFSLIILLALMLIALFIDFNKDSDYITSKSDVFDNFYDFSEKAEK